MGQLELPLLEELLRDKDGLVRAAAVRAVRSWRDAVPKAFELLARAVHDPHARVRLEAVRALAEFRSAQAAVAALAALDYPMDNYLDFALWQAVRELEPYWLPALREGRLPLKHPTRHWAYALLAAQSPGVAEFLWQLLEQPSLSEAQQFDLLRLLVQTGGPQELTRVWERFLRGSISQAEKRLALLQAFSEAARLRKAQPAVDAQERIVELLTSPMNEQLSSEKRAEVLAAMELAGFWKTQAARAPCSRWARQHDDRQLRNV